jgi:hypothetical protein
MAAKKWPTSFSLKDAAYMFYIYTYSFWFLLYINLILQMLYFDNSMNILPCALWGDIGQQFMSHYNSKTDDGPMIIIIKHAQIREPKGL